MSDATQARERRCPACAGAAAEGRGGKNGVPLAQCRACDTLYAALAVGGFDYDDTRHLAPRRLDQHSG